MSVTAKELIERLFSLAEMAVEAAMEFDYGDPDDRFIHRELQELRPLVAAATATPSPSCPRSEKVLIEQVHSCIVGEPECGHTQARAAINAVADWLDGQRVGAGVAAARWLRKEVEV
jgi:hypothetical protein